MHDLPKKKKKRHFKLPGRTELLVFAKRVSDRENNCRWQLICLYSCCFMCRRERLRQWTWHSFASVYREGVFVLPGELDRHVGNKEWVWKSWKRAGKTRRRFSAARETPGLTEKAWKWASLCISYFWPWNQFFLLLGQSKRKKACINLGDASALLTRLRANKVTAIKKAICLHYGY